ncbi:NmrA family NAD(P)-binding protein [Fodinicurvata fenggangensis]|uniref:NmrA family NAD(P)-binding protein n=1 Tax=Fodinicurvata fenggangensis TaxID=1121830 RepID=UPI0004793FF6|nr:NmrA family NAD(P)-binding protein [Fodinicurvata fenggangensis]
MTSNSPIAIVGGRGKTGRRVDVLLKVKGCTTRPLSRSTIPAFDWDWPEGWAEALEGASAAYVTFQSDLAVPGAAEAIAELGRLAQEKGLERIVLLSGRGEPGAERAEEALKGCGVAWTIVRASWFNQNFSESFLRESIVAGEVALPAGEVREPFVDANEIAEVAVAALTDEGHANRLYELTGPRALTFAEAVEGISRELGRPIRYTQLSLQAFRAGLEEMAVPAEMIALLEQLFTETLDGRNSGLTRGVEEALGRPPRDFAEYVRTAAADGAWSMPR